MSLRVIKPGLLTSIQDLGRKGFQKHGVIVSGAMDAYSLRIANLLVGNTDHEAVLEMTLMGPKLKIEKDCLIAITGGNLSPAIDGEPVPMWKPVFVKKGCTIKFGPCKSGCRAYLSVAGGYAIPEVMNSKSTYLRGELGGYKGRALQADDVISFNEQSHHQSPLSKKEVTESFALANWSVNYKKFLPLSESPIIRVTKGSQFEYFTESSKNECAKMPFTVSNQSDRMGYRLSGPALKLTHKHELLSEAVSNGSIQVTPDGNPIILLADRQTTGGYPKIAQVITADLPLIAQVKPGQSIRFSFVTLEDAESLYLQKERQLKELKSAVSLAFKNK
ncbi:antagonist of KipI [Scopulibacillus darangshiensis]|uniref:Antagonist of KipI n=1 Tax=Scopulibacillus darangshiensis TaxID=442528 RepID=A0A4R2NQK8_9BACL|nr:biotin-dependent carboxyltransferase family protein [Scopulibacillus darangshiensis]TCP23741.1 antagonist of KipI [Scopulibacillus darangshiensis]